MKGFLARRFEVLCVLVLVLSAAAWFGAAFYYFDMLSHFRVHYLVLAVLCMPVFAWSGRWKWLAAAGLAAGLNLPPLLPAYLPAVQPEGGSTARVSLRVVAANVHSDNDQYAAFIDWAYKQKPDVIIALEVSPAWAGALKPLQAVFPHHVQIPRHDNFGLSVFSRLPLSEQKLLLLGNAGVPSLLLRLNTGKQDVAILVTHPPPPISEDYFAMRNVQLDDAAAYMARIKGPRMLIGDLNTSQWSPYFTRMRNRAGLRDARNGFGILPTWPASLPGLMIPLDHCLVSPEVTVREIQTGEDIGSDHLPLFVEIAY
ncbi:MAG TPA: endonuclease/exonuclease/phosphatase family protein [Mariprofundaceae bacterium]|nr:endonuclease/exonuclease/phosphatase family protein [Mariprofundaceae bacterium]